MEQSASYRTRFAAGTQSTEGWVDLKPIWKLRTRRNFLPLPGKKKPIRWRPVRRLVTIKTDLSQPMCLSVVSFLTKTVSINVIFMLFSPFILSIYSVINLSVKSAM